MKKAAAAILILDCILGLLLFGLSENRRAAVTTAGGDASAAVWDEEVERKEAEEDVKKIALTFDDGPHPYYTEQLLDGLKERGVHATFFVTVEEILFD